MKQCYLNPNLYCKTRKLCEDNACKKMPNQVISPPVIDVNCGHQDTSIVVIQVIANCEKTAVQCDYCGQILTKPKTDCR